jgi:hypothetical protein
VFFAQVGIWYIVILAAIVNLSLNNGTSTLWTALLSSSLGYLLPNPKLEKEEKLSTKQSRLSVRDDDDDNEVAEDGHVR